MQSIGNILGMEYTKHVRPQQNQPTPGAQMEEMEQ